MGVAQSFSSRLAINPAHVLMLRKWRELTHTWVFFVSCPRNRNGINFCVVLACLGKLNKVNLPSLACFIHLKKTLYLSHLEQLGVIHEAESRVQQCPSRAGEEAGTALCA